MAASNLAIASCDWPISAFAWPDLARNSFVVQHSIERPSVADHSCDDARPRQLRPDDSGSSVECVADADAQRCGSFCVSFFGLQQSTVK